MASAGQNEGMRVMEDFVCNAERPMVPNRPRPLMLAAISGCGVLAGGFLGSATNAVNGSISPGYFVTVMGWHNIEDIWRASVAEGLFEGLLAGVVLSLI